VGPAFLALPARFRAGISMPPDPAQAGAVAGTPIGA
jgi:hypothetical protein